MRLPRILAMAGALLLALHPPSTIGAQTRSDPVRVVTTLPVYSSIVRELGGDSVEVRSIADPNEDAHFVRPKPSFALDLRGADLFVTTGLDLELWVPALLDKAGNQKVLEGGRGYVTAYTGIELLEVPASADRSAGDVHIYGNPHLHTDPLRLLQVARNITIGLKKVSPERAAFFDRRLADFTKKLRHRLFGERLVEILGGETLERLALSGKLHSFLEENDLRGTPLIEELGGWLGAARSLRNRRIVCYHKDWAYFEERFSVKCAAFVETKPGIPPTPRHVARLLDLMRKEGLKVLLSPSYYDRNKIESVARRGGATAVIVPFYPSARRGVDDYFQLIDAWIGELTAALRKTA